MKLEIKTECAVCGEELFIRSYGCKKGLIYHLSVNPCLNCQPTRQEVTTPKAGEKIEVRLEDFPPGNYNTRTATGEYSSDGEVETNNLVNPAAEALWPQWRYPGEEKWRKADGIRSL